MPRCDWSIDHELFADNYKEIQLVELIGRNYAPQVDEEGLFITKDSSFPDTRREEKICFGAHLGR